MGFPLLDTMKEELLFFFIPLRMGSNCFGSGITRREVAVFGSSMIKPFLPS